MQWLHSWIAGVPPVLAFCSPAPWSRLCRRNVAAATSSSAQLQLSPGTGSGAGNIPSLHSVTSHQHLQRMLHLAVALLWAGWKHQVRSSPGAFIPCLAVFLSIIQDLLVTNKPFCSGIIRPLTCLPPYFILFLCSRNLSAQSHQSVLSLV